MEIVMRQRSKAERESSRQGLRAERRNVVGGGKFVVVRVNGPSVDCASYIPLHRCRYILGFSRLCNSLSTTYHPVMLD